VFEKTLEMKGGNRYKIPRVEKAKLISESTSKKLPESFYCNEEVFRLAKEHSSTQLICL
jgi:hypothetical protein